jgi:hypothetical protein
MWPNTLLYFDTRHEFVSNELKYNGLVLPSWMYWTGVRNLGVELKDRNWYLGWTLTRGSTVIYNTSRKRPSLSGTKGGRLLEVQFYL